MCSICEREQREELRSKLAELLRIQPWLKYKDCLAYYKCDKILFTAVKENLQSYYFERVRCGFADKKESLLAVMFLLEKQPEDITLALYENALTYLRRDQGVSAFGSRLHGKNSEIIAIFNLNHPQSVVYDDFVKKYGSRYKVVDASGGEGYYSCVLTDDTMYLSSISSVTLKNALNQVFWTALSILI